MAFLVIPTTLDGSHTLQQEDKKATSKTSTLELKKNHWYVACSSMLPFLYLHASLLLCSSFSRLSTFVSFYLPSPKPSTSRLSHMNGKRIVAVFQNRCFHFTLQP